MGTTWWIPSKQSMCEERVPLPQYAACKLYYQLFLPHLGLSFLFQHHNAVFKSREKFHLGKGSTWSFKRIKVSAAFKYLAVCLVARCRDPRFKRGESLIWLWRFPGRRQWRGRWRDHGGFVCVGRVYQGGFRLRQCKEKEAMRNVSLGVLWRCWEKVNEMKKVGRNERVKDKTRQCSSDFACCSS